MVYWAKYFELKIPTKGHAMIFEIIVALIAVIVIVIAILLRSKKTPKFNVPKNISWEEIDLSEFLGGCWQNDGPCLTIRGIIREIHITPEGELVINCSVAESCSRMKVWEPHLHEHVLKERIDKLLALTDIGDGTITFTLNLGRWQETNYLYPAGKIAFSTFRVRG